MRVVIYFATFVFGVLTGVTLLSQFPKLPTAIFGRAWSGTQRTEPAKTVEGVIDRTEREGLFLLAKAAVQRRLNDPYSAKFESLKITGRDVSQVVCGTVNAKNRLGAYAGAEPFVYERDAGIALIDSESIDAGSSAIQKMIAERCTDSSAFEKTDRLPERH